MFIYLLGDIIEAQGISINQQSLYTAKDAITGSWLHKNGVTGHGTWNFGCHTHEDSVKISGSKGSIEFSVFHENPIVLKSELKSETFTIENPKHIQIHHVEHMRDYLIGNKEAHPSTGLIATHTSWVMDKILGKI